MKTNRGQALVEFILIIPILVLLMITMIDFGNIFLNKYSIENDLDIVSEMYEKSDTDALSSYLSNHNIEIKYERENNYITIYLSKNIEIVSPILISILGSTYEIKTSGVYYE